MIAGIWLLPFLWIQTDAAKGDSRPKLTVSTEVDVASLMTANPLLRRLPMFSGTATTRRSPTPTPEPIPPVDRKRFPNTGDNFDALYRRLNESMFSLAVPEQKQIVPTGRALSDEHLPEKTENDIEEESVEEDPPFAVTDSLLSAMEATPDPTELGPPPPADVKEWTDPPPFTRPAEVKEWTDPPPTTRTFAPADERQILKNPVVTPVELEEEPETTTPMTSTEPPRERGIIPPRGPGFRSHGRGLPGLAPLRKASEWQVQKTNNGRFLVSGTQFYEDNRIDGGVTGMAEEYQPSGNQWELRHIQNDRRYLIEAELTKIRAHAAALKKPAKPIFFGSKTIQVDSTMDLEDPDIRDALPERVWPSKSAIVDENGKTFEKRKITEAGRRVEITLSDRRLFGHDIYSYPGAVIHGPLLRNTRPLMKQNVVKCFDSKPFTTLSGVVPFDRRIGNSPTECLRVCAMSALCKTVVYDEVLSICDVFAEKAGDSTASTRSSSSSTLFEPNVEDPSTCLKGTRARAHAAPAVTRNPVTISAVTLRTPSPEELQIVDRDAGRCPVGEEHLFARLEGVRAAGRLKDKSFVTNEDDCVFACLTDSELEKRGQCGAAEYVHESQECTLYNSLPTELAVHETTTLYYKICVTARANLVCSGATVEHVKQAVLVGAMREAKAVKSRADCIDACVSATKVSGYTCLSVMYYPKEKTNCILNDASVVTSPDSLMIETKAEVDYFGVDECYGLEDVTQKKEDRNLIVEDDIRAGQITKGSRVKVLN